MNLSMPLIVATYERNFPVRERGKRVGRGMALKVGGGSAVAGLAMGAALKDDLGSVAVGHDRRRSGACGRGALSAQIPSESLPRIAGANRPWPHFHLLGEDRQLRLTLGAWMLMGFGNLMLLPLRVEYLAVEKYGVGANAAKIVLLTVTIPALVRLVAPDIRRDVRPGVVLRRAQSWSTCSSPCTSRLLPGFERHRPDHRSRGPRDGDAGGDLMWSLWVTKFAPAGRVADYMGLHTFFTGVRALFAPILAFIVVERFSLHVVAYIAAVLMIISAAVLVPEARAERTERRSTVSPPDVEPEFRSPSPR